MAEDTKQPDSTQSSEPPKRTEVSQAQQSSPPGSQPASPSQADAEKASKVEEAKARVAAAKETVAEKASAAPAGVAPKAPVKKKEEGPKPVDASNNPLVKKLKQSLDGAVLEATEFLGQLSIRIDPSRTVEVCDALKRDGEKPFNYLSDVTCVHF